MEDKIIPCVCITCGIRNDFSEENGYCQNGHDDWLEYRDVFLTEGASEKPLLRAMEKFNINKKEMRSKFIDLSITKFEIRNVNPIKLYHLDTTHDGVLRLQSQLYLGKLTCDFILAKEKLYVWANGKNGFQHYPTDIPHTITKNKEDLKTQKL